MATIQCVNCGSTHGSVAEVRACHVERPNADVITATEAEFGPEPGWEGDAGFDDGAGQGRPSGRGRSGPGRSAESGQARPTGPTRQAARATARPKRAPLPRPAADWAGPDVLGRAIVISPGSAPPEPWSSAPVLVVDQAALNAPAELAERVFDLWLSRTRFVVELAVDLGPEPTEVIEAGRTPHDPETRLDRDKIGALIWANSVDARDLMSARWAGAEEAVARGATATNEAESTFDMLTSTAPPETAGADVLLADGTAALIDGGPLQPSLADDPSMPDEVGLVPRLTLDHGPGRTVTAIDPTAELAPDQLAAVAHEGGAARIIAPAGSGKTRVLTERARHLISGWGIPSGAVAMVAFNRRAQNEMDERTTDLAGLQIRTLNSLGLAIVRGTGPFLKSRLVPRSPDMVDERGVRELIGSLVDFPRRANTDPTAAWIEALSAVRLGLRDPKVVEQEFNGDVDGLVDVAPKYRALLADRNVMDFDEQIIRAVDVLLADPDARAAAQRACRLMLVDEFQDLTPAHLLLVRLVSGPTGDVFGVGDDDQTIYGYTGASPDWLIDYHEWFTGAEHHALGINYRCSPAVVTGASSLLGYNHRRVAKTIEAAPGRTNDGDGLQVVTTDDPTTSAVDRVARLIDEGVDPADIAVLSRVNSSLASVQVALLDRDIPVVAAVNESFLRRSGVRAALAWVSLASGSRLNRTTIAEAARRPSRGLSPRVIEWIGEQDSVDGVERLAARLKDRDSEKVTAFASDLTAARARAERSTKDALEWIRDELGLDATMATLDASRRSVDRSAHGDDLSALVAMAKLHTDAKTFGSWLQDQLTQRGAALGSGVELSTIHRVKGREWPHVIIHEATNGLTPHRLASDNEEERRIFHVGITRSSVTTTVVADSAAPTPFIAEMAGTAPRQAAVDPADERAAADQRRAAAQGSTGRGRGSNRAAATTGPPADPAIRESLRRWRADRARTDGVPAYRVFTDRTLDELAGRLPRDLGQLGKIVGIGPRKLEEFGDQLIAAITEVAGDKPSIPDDTASTRAEPRSGSPAPRGQQTLTGDEGEAVTRSFDPDEEALVVRLRTWRSATAKEAGAPAYTVFTNKTMDELIAHRPTTLAELANINGLGPSRIERFGEDLLEVLNS